MTSEIKTKLISHPMEGVLDIDEHSTPVEYHERTTELTDSIEYDDKDVEIEEQIQEVYDSAMGAFENQMDEAELVEGKYKARNGEVAVQFLNAALNAAKERSHLKQHKDKVAVTKGKLTGAKVENNIIVADRNDILRNIVKGMDATEAITLPEEPSEDPKVVNPIEE